MEDNIASKSDTASNETTAITASNEPTKQLSPAAESAHQMSDRDDLRQAPSADGQVTDGDQKRDQSNGSQRIDSSVGGEQFAEEDGGARLENGLNWEPDQTSPHKSSRSSSLNSDRQKDEDRLESSDANILVKQERLDEDYRDKIDSEADEKSSVKIERDECADDASGNDEASEASAKERPPASYTDFAGCNLEEFLFNLLQTNPKDRMQLLKIEQDLVNLVKDEKRTSLRFPPMSSYHRMLVHRVAAYFGLEHNIDPKGNCVVVNKQDGITRIPELKFQDQINKQSAETEGPRKLILKRNTSSLDGNLLGDGRTDARAANGLDTRKSKSKSFEEREEQYEKVRARIFSQQAARPSDCQLSNINESESDKCNLENNQANYSPVNSNNASTMNHTKHRSNESLKNFSNYFDSGQASYLNATPSNYPPFDGHPMPSAEHHPPFHNPHQLNSNSQFNHLEFNKSNHLNSSFKQPNGDLTDSRGFYKSNGYKGKMPKGNLKPQPNSAAGGCGAGPGSKPPKNLPPPHFYQPNLLQMINPLDPQLYPNWLPDLNATAAAAQQECFAKQQQQQQLYQPMPAYNQLHPNQQKLFLLCNYPETHPFNSDKMVPNQVVLPTVGLNHVNHVPPGNGQPPNNNANKMEKENLNAYVASQMSGLSLGPMNVPADMNDVQNRASGIPICYLKPPYYPMASSNPNELVYQNSLAQRAQLSNQQMLLINPNFNPNTPPTLSNFNRPTNSILPAPAQAIGMTSSQRFSNPSNYPYPVNGSTSHLEMNQMYPHMPTYLMPNTVRQQSPLLPTPVTTAKHLRHHQSNVPNKKMNDNQLTNEQLNGMKNDSRKKMNGFKNEKFEKKSLPQQSVATKPKTSASLPPQQPANATSLKAVPPAPSNQNGTGSRAQNSNGLSNKV